MIAIVNPIFSVLPLKKRNSRIPSRNAGVWIAMASPALSFRGYVTRYDVILFAT